MHTSESAKALRTISLALLVALCAIGLVSVANAAESAFEQIDLFAADVPDGSRAKLTMYGLLPQGTSFPATVHFFMPASLELQSMHEIDFDSNEKGSEPEYLAEVGDETTRYTVILTEERGFVAYFETPGTIYDRTTGMGDSPLASLVFIPPSDLLRMTVGFAAPSEDYIGAGSEVQLIMNSPDGEVYGITRENISAGEEQVFVVAFAPRAHAEEALADQEQNDESDSLWSTHSATLVVAILGTLLVCAIGVLVYLVSRRQHAHHK